MLRFIERDTPFVGQDGTEQTIRAGQWFAQYGAWYDDGKIFSSGYSPKVGTRLDCEVYASAWLND